MKNIAYFSSAVLLTVFVSACSNPSQKTENQADTLKRENQDTLLVKNENATDLDSTDITFFKKAAYGGLFEVEASNKILQGTKDKEVKTFANMMTKDHSDANQKLKALAESKGYILPKALPESKIEKIYEMNKLKEEGRDEFYVQLMINEHRDAIDLFSLASRSKDADISKFATAILPTLNHHYGHIMKIDTLIKAPKVNQGDDLLKISNRKK